MRLAVSVTKAAEHRVGEKSPENFLNSVEAVKNYVNEYGAKFFVNIRGQKADHGIQPTDFRTAYGKALALVTEGYADRDVFISAIIDKVASISDIDF